MIKYLNLKCLSAAEISGELNSVFGDNAPSDATIYRWIAEFQRGRKSTEDDEHRSGRPVDVCTHRPINSYAIYRSVCARMKMFGMSMT